MLAGEGVGGPNSDAGQSLWYSRYTYICGDICAKYFQAGSVVFPECAIYLTLHFAAPLGLMISFHSFLRVPEF